MHIRIQVYTYIFSVINKKYGLYRLMYKPYLYLVFIQLFSSILSDR